MTDQQFFEERMEQAEKQYLELFATAGMLQYVSQVPVRQAETGWTRRETVARAFLPLGLNDRERFIQGCEAWMYSRPKNIFGDLLERELWEKFEFCKPEYDKKPDYKKIMDMSLEELKTRALEAAC